MAIRMITVRDIIDSRWYKLYFFPISSLYNMKFECQITWWKCSSGILIFVGLNIWKNNEVVDIGGTLNRKTSLGIKRCVRDRGDCAIKWGEKISGVQLINKKIVWKVTRMREERSNLLHMLKKISRTVLCWYASESVLRRSHIHSRPISIETRSKFTILLIMGAPI